jgi:hypothetical protein
MGPAPEPGRLVLHVEAEPAQLLVAREQLPVPCSSEYSEAELLQRREQAVEDFAGLAG